MRTPLLSSLLCLAACKVSFNTNVSSPGSDVDAKADAKLAADVDLERASATGGTRIVVRNGNKLDYEGGEIEFETDSAQLRGRTTESILDRLAEVMQQLPELEVRIEAHTDSRGSRPYNRKLSNERAASIMAGLVRRGVAEQRLSSEGVGEDEPHEKEPAACLNKPEDRVPEAKRGECNRIWRINRRASFLVTSGVESLPPEGTAVGKPETATTKPATTAASASERRPDWALRFFGGYTLIYPGVAYNGGHVGVALHASQRFGKQKRGYIGGGPRLHYRGVHRKDDTGNHAFHEFGPEGNLLIGGGSQKLVGLFSLRLGLGLAVGGATPKPPFLGGWAMGGLVVLGKIAPRWSLGGHAEAGITNFAAIEPIVEIGLNIAWHFGRGRRDGI